MNSEHLENLVRWLLAEVLSAGGDGDAIWYCKTTPFADAVSAALKVNNEQKYPMDVCGDSDMFTLSSGQEYLTITNNKSIWDSRPSWSQCSLEY